MPPDPSEVRAEWIERWQQNAILQRQLEQQRSYLLARGFAVTMTSPDGRWPTRSFVGRMSWLCIVMNRSGST